MNTYNKSHARGKPDQHAHPHRLGSTTVIFAECMFALIL